MVAYRSSSVTTVASRTNTGATAPTGIVDGDALFLFVTVALATPPAVTPPTGFSLLPNFPISSASSGSIIVAASAYVKIASGESGNYTVTHATAYSQVYMAAFSAPNTATPFSPNPTVNTGTGTTTTMLGLTTTTDNSVVMTIDADWGDTSNALTPPSGTTPTFTERADQAPAIEVADGTLAIAGATGNKTMTNNSLAADPWLGFMFALPRASTFRASKPYTKLQAVNRSYTY